MPDRGTPQSAEARPRTGPEATSIETIRAWPWVRVPVLSITSERTRAKVSSACPPLIRMPCLAARDRPDTSATGTARISGHGVATTRHPTARMGSPLQAQAAPASATVAARNTMAHRSARRDIGARERWAAATRRTISGYLACSRPHAVPPPDGRLRRHWSIRSGLDPHLPLHRHGFAGQRRLVLEHGGAVRDRAIDRHHVAFADNETIARLDRL